MQDNIQLTVEELVEEDQLNHSELMIVLVLDVSMLDSVLSLSMAPSKSTEEFHIIKKENVSILFFHFHQFHKKKKHHIYMTRL